MFTKEPTEVLNYGLDWSDWLGDLVIASSSWVVPSGITEVSTANDDTTTTIRLSGGTWAEVYEIANTIVADNGETETRRFSIKIQRSVAYCTPVEVRRRMFGGSGAGGSATTTALPAAELEDLIEQASRMIDLFVGCEPGYFNEPLYGIATEMTFYGTGTSYLRLPPYVPGSLETVTAPTAYTVPSYIEQGGYLIPVDAYGVGPQGPYRYPPYTTGWWEGVPLTVSAVWGWQETPRDVKLATIELVINLVRETDPATLKLTDLEGQPLREKMPPRVFEIARRYRPKVGAAFA